MKSWPSAFDFPSCLPPRGGGQVGGGLWPWASGWGFSAPGAAFPQVGLSAALGPGSLYGVERPYTDPPTADIATDSISR